MARDRESDALGANQSKRPGAAYVDHGDQPQQHHRVKGQKHVVGGATGSRLHARIPSSKALYKHHAAAAAKLNRKHGSLSPDRGGIGAALASNHHRRATSELKLSRNSSATNLKKDPSHSNLKRNRSHAEVGRKTKSAAAIHRSVSNPAVHKLKSSASSKVHFNLGEEEGHDEDQDDDEWVDASTSASPLLSRRGSVVSSAYTASHPADRESRAASPAPHAAQLPPAGEKPDRMQNGVQNGATNGADHADQTSRNKTAHNQYLTSRILSRTPSHGAPPKMSAETASARPPSIRQLSPPGSSAGQSQHAVETPGSATQVRPGSSGKAELTSRFVGHNSQEPGSGIAGESFILAANRTAGGVRDGLALPKRRQSSGALSQARGIDALNARRAAAGNASDEDDDDGGGGDDNARAARASRSRRSGEYVVPRDMNRTQQKLNLQRASSSLEPAHPHPGLGIGPPGVAAGAGPLIGVPTTYDARDPRIAKSLERTGMEYLTVRRHLNPVARSVARVMQLPGLQNSRRIPHPAVPRHSSRRSEHFLPPGSSGSASGSAAGPQHPPRDGPLTRNSSMADLMINGGAGGGGHASTRPPPTPRSGGRGGGFSALQSASSSLGTEDGGGSGGGNVPGRTGERRGRADGHGHGHGHGHGGLSGSSLLDGAEDAGTVAQLRMMWEKSSLELSASQD